MKGESHLVKCAVKLRYLDKIAGCEEFALIAAITTLPIPGGTD